MGRVKKGGSESMGKGERRARTGGGENRKNSQRP